MSQNTPPDKCSLLAQCFLIKPGRLGSENILVSIYIVRLSLLTMTNPNQLCDVLLFVCSKMADETNLSSKLPDADRT